MNIVHCGTSALAFALALGVGSTLAADIKPSAADNDAHATAIRTALDSLGSVKESVARYRLHNAGFPGNNAEAGIVPPAAFATAALKRVEVGSNGVIQATLTADSGVDDGTVILTPAMSPQTDLNQIDWTCSSPSYSDISDITNGFCSYSKLP
jgi:hypothetical protein